MVCMTIAAMCFAIPASADSYIIGDADGDGEVTILDATKIQRVLADLAKDEDGMIARRGDANHDGLDILDATRIQRYLVGYNDSQQLGFNSPDETVASTEAPTSVPTDSDGWNVIIYRP